MSRIVPELRQWRTDRGLTFEEAAALVVVDGVPVQKSTWHAWESARRVPAPAYMTALYELTGGAVRPEHFYHLPAIETPKAPIGRQMLLGPC
jgi:transcriptional regulator with XRE-family HTH domain